MDFSALGTIEIFNYWYFFVGGGAVLGLLVGFWIYRKTNEPIGIFMLPFVGGILGFALFMASGTALQEARLSEAKIELRTSAQSIYGLDLSTRDADRLLGVNGPATTKELFDTDELGAYQEYGTVTTKVGDEVVKVKLVWDEGSWKLGTVGDKQEKLFQELPKTEGEE